jgi:hypothetical protein
MPATQTEEEKKTLLAEIETLIAYGEGDEPAINPALLAYLDLDALRSIKASLLEKRGTLSDEDKMWLQQFKRYE